MESLSLFDEVVGVPPPTEGIKYAGSKQKLLPHILTLARKTGVHSVFDGFSGSSRVSQAFAQQGYSVISNDLSAWSEALSTCYLLHDRPKSHYEKIINHLNRLQPTEGWFTEHYGGDPNGGSSIGVDGLKKPWQRHNTMRLDAIREEIDALDLSDIDRAVAITSLIRALDEVDSTLGHFASYLNGWSPRSYKQLQLRVPTLVKTKGCHTVHRKDIFNLLPTVNADLAYLDPPYGSNNEKMPPSRVRYGAYYHLWTTVVLNDKPQLFGKAKRRSDTSDTISASVFEEFRRNDKGQLVAVESIRKVIADVRAKHIILSYSSGGRATAEQLNQVLEENGKLIEVVEVDYKRNVMAGMRWTNEWVRDAEEPNREFLFLLEKHSA